ncbi:MAG TPA: hypothetical protein VHR47_12430 [Bacillota bacterium]|nr:hypothetical protein [Bacillota bacterium]
MDCPCLILPRTVFTHSEGETVSATEPGGDGGIDAHHGLQSNIDNLYSVKTSGFLLGIKAVYKPTDQFTLESSFGEIIRLRARFLSGLNFLGRLFHDRFDC